MEKSIPAVSILPTVTLMKFTFGILSIVAGAYKLKALSTNWEHYLAPTVIHLIPFSAHTFMMIVGAMEIITGIVVLLRPAIGGFILAAWLTIIAISLIAGGKFLDIAVRDLVIAISAFSMAKLSKLIA